MIYLLLLFFSVSTASALNCDRFNDERIKELNAIAALGDLKLESTLAFEEYEALQECKDKFQEQTVVAFKETVEKLEKKLLQFASKNAKINDLLKEEEQQSEFDHLLKSDWGRELILAVKIFIAQVFSDAGEVTRLNLYSFMKSNTKAYPRHIWLLFTRIYEISELQSAEVDALINEEIWKEHEKKFPKLKNTNNDDQSRMRVLIEGGGPIGLISAIRLFMAGAHVTLVNSRGEYTRPQVIGLDMAWLAQLRFFLGTKFGELINNTPNSIGRTVVPHKGVLPIQYIEKVLRSRIEELNKFIYAKKGKQIELIYGSQVKEIIKKGDKTFAAITRKWKWQRKIQFDLIVCAGGAKDELRNKIFGMSPTKRSPTINNGLIRYDKQTPEIHFPELLLIFGEEIDKSVAKFMRETNWENALDGIELPNDFKSKTLNIFDEFNTKKMDNFFILLETSNAISIPFRTPLPMVELEAAVRTEKENLKGKRNSRRSIKGLDLLWKRVLNKWSKVILDSIYENSANKLPDHKEIDGWKWTKPGWSLTFELDKNGDVPPGNGKKGALSIDPTSGTFDVVVQTFDLPIMQIGGTNSLAVVLGDALAAQHYFTGSGMSSGRMGVDRFLNNLSDLNGPYSEEKIAHFIEKVTKDLKGVSKHMYEFAKKVVEIYDSKEVKSDH